MAGLGATSVESPRAVAASADVLITMLPDSGAVEAVALGPDGIREGAYPDRLFVDMSTINPVVSKRIGHSLSVAGMSMLDAPVSGGEKGAIEGTLSIMVGGEREAVSRAMPVFQVLGTTITHMGPLGTGGFTKLANQIVVAVNLAAIGEALVFGAKAGVDPDKMVRALGGGMAGSRCLDQKAPGILRGEFDPGFKTDLHLKDLALVHEAACSLQTPVPITGLVEQFFAAVRSRGRGSLDHSSVVTFFEDLAGVEVRSGRPDKSTPGDTR